MSERFDIQERWPELFTSLTAAQRHSVSNTLAGQWHEGWAPNRDDVADLAGYVSGEISEAEYDRRSDEKIERARALRATAHVANAV